jgi:hypothetical protein
LAQPSLVSPPDQRAACGRAGIFTHQKCKIKHPKFPPSPLPSPYHVKNLPFSLHDTGSHVKNLAFSLHDEGSHVKNFAFSLHEAPREVAAAGQNSGKFRAKDALWNHSNRK